MDRKTPTKVHLHKQRLSTSDVVTLCDKRASCLEGNLVGWLNHPMESTLDISDLGSMLSLYNFLNSWHKVGGYVTCDECFSSDKLHLVIFSNVKF